MKKVQLKRKDEVVNKLSIAWDAFSEAVDDFNIKMQEAFSDLQGRHLAAYNEALSEARDFVNEIAQETADYISDKSEKWQEGDKGQAYLSFQEAYESLDLDDIELDEPEGVELNCETHYELIDQLPDQVEA